MNAENVDLTVPNNHGHLLKKFKFRLEVNFYFEKKKQVTTPYRNN